MEVREVTKSVAEWVDFCQDTKQILTRISPIKLSLEKNLMTATKVFVDFENKKAALLEVYTLKDKEGNPIRVDEKIPLMESTMNNIKMSDKDKFEKEFNKLLEEQVTLPLHLTSPNSVVHNNGTKQTLFSFLETTTDMNCTDCLFLIQNYLIK